MKKMWFLAVIISLLAIMPLVSAEVSLNEKAINNILIKEFNSPIIYEITIRNDNSYPDFFMIDTLFDMNITPHEKTTVNANSEKTVTREIYPSQNMIDKRKGTYSFEYYAKGDNTDISTSNLVIKFLSLSDLISIDFPASVESTGKEINAKIMLTENTTLDAKMTISSPLFDVEKSFVLTDKVIEFTIPLKEEMPKAGIYEIKALFKIGDNSATVSKDIILKSIISANEDRDVKGNFLCKTETITTENTGNSVTDIAIVVKRSSIASLFTFFNIKPTSIKSEKGVVTYEFTSEMNPKERITINATTSYYLPILVIILLIVAGWIFVNVITPQVKVKKKAVKVRTKSGVFATKIVLSAENKGKDVFDVKIIDRLPAFTELVPEKFGTISPSEIRKKTLIWHINKIGKGEEIMLSYIVYSKLDILGKLDIPRGYATYKTEKGDIKESKSNALHILAADEVAEQPTAPVRHHKPAEVK